MTIEQLIGLDGAGLEALLSNPIELEKHLGWMRDIARPKNGGQGKVIALKSAKITSGNVMDKLNLILKEQGIYK